MRRYVPDYVSCGISKWRYSELQAYCRQYAEKKAEADTLLTVGSPKMSGMPHGSGTGDPVARAAEKREKLLHDCAIVEKCAKIVNNGDYETAIIQNCCYGKSYEFIKEYLPTWHRQSYYTARRRFFMLLNKSLDMREKFDEWIKEIDQKNLELKCM